MLHCGGENKRRPTNGLGGYITYAAWEVPNTSKQWTKLEVAHKWAGWLHNPCGMGDSQRFTAGEKIGAGPQVGKVAT